MRSYAVCLVLCGLQVAAQTTPSISLGGTACTKNDLTPCNGQTIAEDTTVAPIGGYFSVDAVDAGQTTSTPTVTCTPLNYGAICSGHVSCGTAIFSTVPSATSCSTAGTVTTCGLTYAVTADEFTEGLNPGEVTCTVRTNDPDGTTTNTFTIRVTPVNDPPTFSVAPPATITTQEDCGCFPSICPSPATAQSTGMLTNVVPGPYNEIVYTAQQMTVGTTTSDDSMFEQLPNSDFVTVSTNGDVTFTPAPNKAGSATVTVTVTDDGVNPCLTMPCSTSTPATSTPDTFSVTVNQVNDPPFVAFSGGSQVIFVDEECMNIDVPLISSLTAGSGLIPTPDELLQVISMGPLTLSPASASALFSVQPTLSSGGPFTGQAPGAINVQFSCNANGASTTHPPPVSASTTCTLPPPNYTPTGVLGPAGGPYSLPGATAPLPRKPTGAVRVSFGLTDNGANDMCSSSSSTVDFDIVIREVNDGPSFTLMANPNLQMYEDAYESGGLENWQDCRSPYDVEGRGCTPEVPRLFSVNDFIAAFSTGSDLENKFEQLKWTFQTDHGEYFRQLYIPTYTCPLDPTHDDLFIELEPHANGRANVYIDCEDTGVEPMKCGQIAFTINIIAVNDPPDACPRLSRVEYDECSLVLGCAMSVDWLDQITPGGGDDEAVQDVTANCVANSNDGIFTGAVSMDVSTGVVSFTLAEYAQGTGTVVCTLKDNGGVGPNLQADGSKCDIDESVYTLNVQVNEVNDPPTFVFGVSNGNDLILEEDSMPQPILGFATSISPSGDPKEATQTFLSFDCVADNPALFSTQPSLAIRVPPTEADLTILPAADAFGSTTVRCTLVDSGSCTNLDCDHEGAFRVTIRPLNDPPILTLPSPTLNLRSSSVGVYTGAVVGVPGPANEADQVLTYTTVIVGTGTDLFTQVPEVLPDGTLQYQTKPGISGSVELEIVATDNGGGVTDTSTPVYLTLVFQDINYPPSFTLATRDVYVSVAGLIQERDVATDISYLATESIKFELSGYDTALFNSPLTMDETGKLTADPKVVGVTKVLVRAVDNGTHCTPITPACPDNAATADLQFVIEVVEKLPLRFLRGDVITVAEDSTLHSATWATGIATGDGSGTSVHNVTFTIDGFRADLFTSEGITMDSAGVLTFTPAPDAAGETFFRACLTDQVSTVCDTGKVVITEVNDAPRFTLLREALMVPVGELETVFDNVISGVKAGPLNEDGQGVVVSVGVPADCAIFAVKPIFEGFSLRFSLTSEAQLLAAAQDRCDVEIIVTDDLGANTTKILSIITTEVKVKPTFTIGNDIFSRPEKLGSKEVKIAQYISDIDLKNTGTLGVDYFFMITLDEAKARTLFDVNPAIDVNGDLTFTPKQNVPADAAIDIYVTLRRSDSSPDNLLQSDTMKRTITLIGVDSYLIPDVVVGDVEVAEDAGFKTIKNWCDFKNLTVDTFAGSSIPEFVINIADPTNFKTQPKIVTSPYPACDLTFETSEDFFGSIDLSVYFNDAITILTRSAKLSITPINDPPSFTLNELFRVIHLETVAPTNPQSRSASYGITYDDTAKTVDISLTPFFTTVSKGALNEAGQNIAWALDSFAQEEVFTAKPSVAADTSMAMKIKQNVESSVLITITGKDDGTPAMQTAVQKMQLTMDNAISYFEVKFGNYATDATMTAADKLNANIQRLRASLSQGVFAGGVDPNRIAIHTVETTTNSGDSTYRAVISIVEKAVNTAELSRDNAVGRLLGVAPETLGQHGIGEISSLGVVSGGGGGGGGGTNGNPATEGEDDDNASMTWVIVIATLAAALFLIAAAVFVVKRICIDPPPPTKQAPEEGYELDEAKEKNEEEESPPSTYDGSSSASPQPILKENPISDVFPRS